MGEKNLPPDIVADPYADYDALLSPLFTPSKHANSLVLATNDPSDKLTDLTSPMQRIRYDLEEVNRRIDSLVRGVINRANFQVEKNSETLVDQVNHVGEVTEKVQEICNAAGTLESSFERYQRHRRH